MKSFPLPQKISTRVFVVAGLFFLLAGILVVVMVNFTMRKQAILDAESKARIILDKNLATHAYFTHDLKPTLFKLTEKISDPDYFEPIWMSSSYAIRQIEVFFKQLTSEAYYYKECAVNARSPSNEADAFEREFIQALNRDKDLEIKTAIRTFGDEPFFVVLRRGEVIEKSCGRCHTDPQVAPKDMLKLYGDKRGFNRKLGEVVSAISIRIPLQKAFESANQFSKKLSLVLVSILGGLFFILQFFYRRMVFKPLESIRQKALLIANSVEHLGEKIPDPGGRELIDLTTAFNRMSETLQENRDRLEERVRERTQAIERVNERLSLEIEERKRAELAIRESEANYRNMMEAIIDPVYICSSDLRIEYTNPAMIKRIGGDAIGKPCYEALQGLEHQCPGCRIQKVMDGAHFFTEVSSNLDGRRFHISNVPVHHADGSVSKLAIFRDITEIREMEAELAQSRKLQAIGVMAGGIAHDFSNLITIIQGNIELAQEDLVDSDEERLHNLIEARKACQKAAELIRKFLIFSRGFIAEKETIGIPEIFAEIGKTKPGRETWPIELDLEEDLPHFQGDRSLLELVLKNLVENAAESMPEGGPIRISARRLNLDNGLEHNKIPPNLSKGPYVEISVSDTGRGIEKENIEKVFDPYYSTKQRGVQKGMGFGLSIVYAVIARHGGAVLLESEPKKGTTVKIYLPAANAENPPEGDLVI